MTAAELEALRQCAARPGGLGDKCRAIVRSLMTNQQGGTVAIDPYSRTGIGLWGRPSSLGNGFTATLPQPTRGGGAAAQLNLGDIGGQLAGIGLDWLRQRVLGGGSGAVVPGGTGATQGGGFDVVPQQGCPEGQTGYPPLCFDITPGGATQGGGLMITPGEAVMGRFGAALQPNVKTKQIRRCLRGMVLGNDGLCYNRRDLAKRDRMWIPGRKPLLTGGDLNAIAKAARAAGKMKTQQKRLQKLGLLPKQTRRGMRISPHTVVRSGPPGTSIVNVD